MRSWQNQTWQNQSWQNQTWQNQTWQNKIWQNQTWQNIFYCKISNFWKYKFPYFASKKGVQTSISKVCQKAQIFSKVIKFCLKISLQIHTKIFKTCSERNDIVTTSDEGFQKINSFLSCSNSCQLRILSTFNLPSLFLSNRCPSTLLCRVGLCQTLRIPFILSSPILSTFILSSLILSNTCLSTLLCQVGFCQTLRSLFVLESGSLNWNNA